MEQPRRIHIVEVGLRDGLQTQKRIVPTHAKVRAIASLMRAGVPEIEATSFVHPQVYPQLADAPEVLAQAPRAPGTRLTALVPNLTGAARALEAGADALRVIVCASETYNRRNVGMEVEKSLEQAARIWERAAAASVPVMTAIGVAFGCPFEGEVPSEHVLEMLRRLIDMGVPELCLADSAGLAKPGQVSDLVREARRVVGNRPLSLHLHDTGGLGLANLRAAMEAGITAFDASFGGLGGCAANPASTGNISTEALVRYCEAEGIDTGIQLPELEEVSREVRALLDENEGSPQLDRDRAGSTPATGAPNRAG